ncbi:hypothetical protein C5Y93_13555 [Blastopirellula marina]|uniref:SMODS and SLOG-associating 2TM effector domain-containing protein n=1 Tax=Blastopirellula marina TaxID=124 RepID=A0A2S8GM12_9BACT|nr:hypothetical protein C5Y93_13555 [Blastopirellula marina]
MVSFLLSAFAVAMALLPVGFHWNPHDWKELACVLLELFSILIILLIVVQANVWGWHQRWIDYRLIAELIFHLRIVAPLGGASAFPQLPAHWQSYGQPAATWMAWYVRAIERRLGLPDAQVNQGYLLEELGRLKHHVEGQVDYHHLTAKRYQRIEWCLFVAGLLLLVATLGCCIGHAVPFISHDWHLPESMPHWLTFCCGFFPALGAAFAGLVNQGEFRRIEKRSESMVQQLKLLIAEIDRLQTRMAEDQSGRQYSPDVLELASRTARTMLNEVLDWRVVFLDRPIHPPV